MTNGTMAGFLTNGMMTGASTVSIFTSQRTQKMGDLLENQAKRNGESYILSPVLPAASTLQPEETKIVVDSGAGMLVVTRKDRNSAELETVRSL